ncbi:FkbM family methyltransferase [Pseudorhizobium tarimense]|uniref:FkbM family methyltransferase n=1 Tax=Pseudorhizobium tarimense TaxID=1079109 RepID=A0ABV2H8R6_9HYPH|nr:FkbM family methyltransferase [Pseudorhizobium tarimense]MCJ8520077.1 FkbM family methyltransferase [Pseudorhizobium tarimense]
MSPEFWRAFGLWRSIVIYYGQPWRRHKLQTFYRQFVTPGDLAFDIGAHVGSRSRTLLKLGAKVIAVEPQRDFADFISRRIDHPHLTLVRKAVGKVAGTVDLHISTRHPTVTTTSSSWISSVTQTSGFEQVSWDRVEKVERITIDQMIADHGCPKFCKIDVEGAEAEILRGLTQPIPIIAFEYVPAAMDVAFQVVDELERLGNYVFNRTAGEDHDFAHSRWLTPIEIRKELSALKTTAKSGDVYARLEGS